MREENTSRAVGFYLNFKEINRFVKKNTKTVAIVDVTGQRFMVSCKAAERYSVLTL